MTSADSLYSDMEDIQVTEETLGGNGSSLEYVETTDEQELRALISNVSDVIEVLVPVPEWTVNGKVVQVLVRALTTKERTQFINAMQKVNYDLTKLYPDLVIMTCRHPVTKKLLFTPADRGMLLDRVGNAIERLAMKASTISGMDEAFLNEIKKN